MRSLLNIENHLEDAFRVRLLVTEYREISETATSCFQHFDIATIESDKVKTIGLVAGAMR